MFLDLFYGLKDEGVPISIQEWQMLMTALEKNLHKSDLLTFYNLAKSVLIKSETYFDAYDRVFAKAVLEALVARGIFVRMPFAAPQNRCIRISCGTNEDLDLLARTLPEALAEAAKA